jgi:hypothetical protein
VQMLRSSAGSCLELQQQQEQRYAHVGTGTNGRAYVNTRCRFLIKYITAHMTLLRHDKDTQLCHHALYAQCNACGCGALAVAANHTSRSSGVVANNTCVVLAPCAACSCSSACFASRLKALAARSAGTTLAAMWQQIRMHIMNTEHTLGLS